VVRTQPEVMSQHGEVGIEWWKSPPARSSCACD
jgi:hypothetical protein